MFLGHPIPPKVFIYGIEGKDFNPGEGLSEEVKAALPRLKDLVLTDIERFVLDEGKETIDA